MRAATQQVPALVSASGSRQQAASGASPVAARLRIDSRRPWFPDLVEAFRFRQLVLLLSRRDITVMYRQTILGSIWIVAAPLVSAGLFTFVFGRVAHLSSGGVPYFAFSYAGLLTWNLFSGTLTTAASSLSSSQSLFTRIYFPRLILPVSKMATTLVNTAVNLGMTLVILVAFHVGFSLRILLLPAWLALTIVFSVGASLTLSSIGVLYRDVQYATQVIVPLLMFLTPVAYSSSAVPHALRGIYLLNPLAAIVEGSRWSLVGHTHLSMWAVAYSIAMAFVFLLAGLVVFARLEWKFADVV